MLCNLQIFSGCVCPLEQLHAQSPFLFPIVFSINLIPFFDISSVLAVPSPRLFGYVLLYFTWATARSQELLFVVLACHALRALDSRCRLRTRRRVCICIGSTRCRGNHMHDHSRFQRDIDDVTGVSLCLFVCFIMETLQAEASLQGIQVNHKLLPKWMYRRKRAEIARKLIPQ